MEVEELPTLEESIAKFANRVTAGKASPEELAFMTEAAKLALRKGKGCFVDINDRQIASALNKSLGAIAMESGASR